MHVMVVHKVKGVVSIEPEPAPLDDLIKTKLAILKRIKDEVDGDADKIAAAMLGVGHSGNRVVDLTPDMMTEISFVLKYEADKARNAERNSGLQPVTN